MMTPDAESSDPTAPRSSGSPAADLQALLATGGLLRIPDVVDGRDAATWVARIEAASPALHPFSPAFAADSVGLILDHVEDLRAYFAAVPEYVALLEGVGADQLEAEILRTLSARSAGAPIRIAVHPEWGRYGFSTLRRLPPGGLIPPHCETEQIEGPQFAHLRDALEEGADVLSWFAMLQAPEAGGALCRWDVARGSEKGRAIYAERGRAGEILAGSEHARAELEVGALAVFAGGRHFHEICPVEGGRPRWTIGGFLGRAREGGFIAWC